MPVPNRHLRQGRAGIEGLWRGAFRRLPSDGQKIRSYPVAPDHIMLVVRTRAFILFRLFCDFRMINLRITCRSYPLLYSDSFERIEEILKQSSSLGIDVKLLVVNLYSIDVI